MLPYEMVRGPTAMYMAESTWGWCKHHGLPGPKTALTKICLPSPVITDTSSWVVAGDG